jgi:exopolyphosphatase/guanosine-5'-triphosphate,3'-diphosphate pyrophosphatase
MIQQRTVVIDVGSNSTKVACYEKNLKNVRNEKWNNRIIEDIINNNGYISSKKIEDTILWISNQLDIIKEWNREDGYYSKFFCFGTEALRRAKNCDELIERLRSKTQMECRILKPEEEIICGCEAVKKALKIKKGIVLDIGGGSSEIGFFDGELKYHISIPEGCVTMMKKYNLNEKIKEELIYNICHDFKQNYKNQIREFKNRINDEFDSINKDNFIGIGGTIKHTARFCHGKYCFKNYIWFPMELKDVKDIMKAVLTRDVYDRKYILGLNKSRADILGAGIIILVCIMEILECKDITITRVGAREGIILYNL